MSAEEKRRPFSPFLFTADGVHVNNWSTSKNKSCRWNNSHAPFSDKVLINSEKEEEEEKYDN